MSHLWRYLLRENPMQIETTRAIRRFTVSGDYTATTQRTITRILFGLLYVLYAWFLVTIVMYKDDMSQGILWFEFGLLTLLIPGSLYTAISGERERMTWDSLILTNLSPSRILAGKLLWRLSLAGIIMLIFLPPLLLTHCTSHYNKSYALPALLWIQFLLAAWCVFLATFTVYISANTKRSVATLSIVTLSLLSTLVLLPMLMSVFGVSMTSDSAFTQGYTYGYENTRPPTAWIVSSLIAHLNPALVILWMENSSQTMISSDMWRDSGIFLIAPFLYLIGAGLCVAGTLKALARLGMPIQATRKEKGG